MKTAASVLPVAVKFRHFGSIVHNTDALVGPMEIKKEGPSLSEKIAPNWQSLSYYTNSS